MAPAANGGAGYNQYASQPTTPNGNMTIPPTYPGSGTVPRASAYGTGAQPTPNAYGTQPTPNAYGTMNGQYGARADVGYNANTMA